MPPHAPSRRRRFSPQWAAVLAALLLLGGIMAWSRYDAWIQQDHREQERLLAQARLLQFILGKNIATANAILKEQGQQWLLDRDTAATNRRLEVLDTAQDGVRSLMLLDADGISRAASSERLIGRNFSERPYFRYFSERQGRDQLFISPPFRGVLGSDIITLSRSIYDAGGTFRGVATATLDPEFFAPLLKAILTTSDMRATIVHSDGRLFLAEPERFTPVVINLNEPGTIFRRHMDSGNEFDVIKGTLVVTREYGYWATCTIQTPGLETSAKIVVTIGRNIDAIFMAWRRDTILQAVLFLLIAAASCAMMNVYLKRKQKFERELAEAGRELEAKALFVQAVTDGIPGLIGYWNADLKCEFANLAYLEWFGKSPEEMIGISIQEALGESLFRQNESYIYAALWGEPQTFERTIQKADGSLSSTLARYIPDRQDGKVRGFFVLVSDVTEMKQTQAKLETLVTELNMQAVTDVLTGLANRRHFWERARAEIVRSSRYNTPLFLIMLDIDKFKAINDGFGHAAGDEVLRNLASTARTALRETDVIGRLGGEEFGVLLIQTDEDHAKLVAERLRQAVEASEVAFEGGTIRYTVSLGLASARQNEASVDELVKRADMALYQAKETGRNRVCYADDLDLGEAGAQPPRQA